jgi:hypothetical protein
MEVKVEGIEEVNSLISGMPKVLYDQVKLIISRATLSAHSTIRGNFGTGANQLKSRTGSLSRSLQTKVSGDNLKTLAGRVYTGMVYAPIQEEGGTVNAKDKYRRVPGGPYLNIPLSANKTAAGVMRKSARDVFSEGGYIVKSKAGNYLVMSKAGQPMFVLKKSVTIPARLGMKKAAEDEVPTILSELSKLRME